jgi:hypothetical protein
MRREFIYSQSLPAVMHWPVLVIAALMLPLNATVATAMPEPTIARIKAYSAADAPLSSRKKDVTNLTMLKTLSLQSKRIPFLRQTEWESS